MADHGSKASGSAAEIVFRDVTKRYPGRPTAAVEHLSLVVPAGEICVLVGPSGAGKTTAMKLVNRLIDFDEADLTIDGRSVRSGSREHDGHPQTILAVSAIVRSFAH
jgi:osmoprotectant transport system ATP-binding protein